MHHRQLQQVTDGTAAPSNVQIHTVQRLMSNKTRIIRFVLCIYGLYGAIGLQMLLFLSLLSSYSITENYIILGLHNSC